MEVPTGHNADEGRDPLAALPAGTVLRGYEIVSVLGEGAFGITYLARDVTLGRDVAVKEYLPSSLALRLSDATVVPRSTSVSEDFIWGRDRFLDEARTLAKLDGVPGIVRVIDYLQANGTAYMVMVLARGVTLQQRIKTGGALSPIEIDRILGPLLEGLEQVHATGYLHRDIKPSNIILDARGLPTLIDFGASRAAMLNRTTALTAIFTPGYAAAEQFMSTKQGPWTDIYGLSATLYHAIAGAQPPSAIERTLEDACKPLLQLAPAGFDRSVLAGVDAGMAVRPADRPQSIAAWRDLLGRRPDLPGDTVLMRQPQAEAPPPPSAGEAGPAAAVVPSPPARAGWRKRPGVWLAIVAAGVVLAGGGYLVSATMEERRNAEAAVFAARQKTEDTQRQAAIDAQKKSEAALAAVQLQRRKAEEELAKLKVETEARRKADDAQRQQAAAQKAQEEAARKDRPEADLAARRQAEDEAARKRAAAEDEARKQADIAVAPFDWAMRDWMAQYDVKQASIAVLRGDRLVYTKGYNGRSADQRLNIWGLSRTITAVCIATLVEEKKLGLDDKIGRLLQPAYSRFGRPADPRIDDIRIADLLAQRGGFPGRMGGNGLAPGALQLIKGTPLRSATVEMLMPAILAQRLASTPGERYETSAPNYLLLGQVIEAVTGEPYADACARRVLAKAGIARPQLDPLWGRLLHSTAGWSLSGPEYLAFLRLYRARQPDLLGPDVRRWLWEGDNKWIDSRREIAYSLGVTTKPVDRNLWSFGTWDWHQPDAKDGPIAIKQGTYMALRHDGTGWFASFDTVSFEPDAKPMQALEKALWNARSQVKSWPETDGFAERGIRPVSVQQGSGQGR
ncbi:MAG TPA: serine hydrolase [Reyranella sp.]|nr:serine hydrolase [Reyranella sp.]